MGEELVAPGNGITHGLLAGRHVPRTTTQERQPLFQPRE
jgi:hypothetical protein